MKILFHILNILFITHLNAQSIYDKEWSVKLPFSENNSYMLGRGIIITEDKVLLTYQENKIIYYDLPDDTSQLLAEIGSPSNTQIIALKSDQQGNIYVIGKTSITTNFTTTNTYKETFDTTINYGSIGNSAIGHTYNHFIAKYDSEGNLLYRSYLDRLEDIHTYLYKFDVDEYGNSYILVYLEPNTILPNAPFQTNVEPTDVSLINTIFGNKVSAIVKLTPQLQLDWKTLFCHQNTTVIKINAANNKLSIIGRLIQNNLNTYNPSFFSTPGAMMENNPHVGSYTKHFLNVFDSNGTRSWGTYLNEDNYNYGAILDLIASNQSIYVIHYPSLEVDSNTYFLDNFPFQLSKFTYSGSKEWTTAFDKTYATLGLENTIWRYGKTLQNSGIATLNAYQTTKNATPPWQNYSNTDAFHQMLSSDGTQIDYGSYLGNYGEEETFRIFQKQNLGYYSLELIKNYQYDDSYATHGQPLASYPFITGLGGWVLSSFVRNTTVANESFHLENVTIYPNPVQNQLNISYETPIDDIRIYNLLGQKLKAELKNSDDEIQINTSSWTAGMYTIVVTSEGKIGSYKIVKK